MDLQQILNQFGAAAHRIEQQQKQANAEWERIIENLTCELQVAHERIAELEDQVLKMSKRNVHVNEDAVLSDIHDEQR